LSDYLIKALAYEGQVRAYAILSTNTVSEAQRRHDTWPIVSAALGRTLSASAMVGAMMKGNDKITVKVEGGGPIGAIIVDANAKGQVRGYVKNPHVHFDLNDQGKLDVARVVGTSGFLTVVKDLGLKEHFTGQVPIISGEIGEDFTYYFAASEQVPSAVGVGVIVNPDHSILASGGFIIQLLPGTEDEIIDKIEKKISAIPPISTLVHNGLTPEQILEQILGTVKVIEKLPVEYRCQCSKERIANALVGLGADEIKDIIDKEGQAEAQCHFCNETYLLNKEELQHLLERTNEG
jgi:molecular chaperone Hsp33